MSIFPPLIINKRKLINIHLIALMENYICIAHLFRNNLKFNIRTYVYLSEEEYVLCKISFTLITCQLLTLALTLTHTRRII